MRKFQFKVEDIVYYQPDPWVDPNPLLSYPCKSKVQSYMQSADGNHRYLIQVEGAGTGWVSEKQLISSVEMRLVEAVKGL